MKIRLIIIIVAFAATMFNLSAKELEGTVYGDEGENKRIPLPKATLQWVGTKSGTYSDKDGKFHLPFVDGSRKLMISYVGYKRDTIEIKKDQSTLDIVMQRSLTTNELYVDAEQPTLLVSKSEINMQTITKKGLQKAACCNLSESFQTNPSVDVSYSDALTGAKQIQLLGLQGTYIQMLNEKIPSFRGLAQTFGLNYVPGPWMESIQISKGAASVTTGYESITGQINVEYKKPETSEKFYANLYGDQYGRMEANFDAAANLSEKVSTMLFAHGNMFQNKLDGNSDGFLDKPMIKFVNLFNRWDIHADGFEAKYGVKALYEDRQGGQKLYYTQGANDTLYGIGIKTQRYDLFFKNGFIFNNHSSLGTIVSGFYHDQNSVYGRKDYTGKQTNLNVNILYDTELKEEVHKISAGITYQMDKYDEKLNDSAFARTESVPGAFLEYVYGGIPNLSVITGFRADYNSKYGTFWTPRLHLRYALTDKILLRASAGKGYHTPTIIAENSWLLASSRKFITDEDLKPEEAWNFGLNATADFELFGLDFTLNAEYYRTDFVNQIIVDMDYDSTAVHFYNLDGKSYSNSFQIDLTFKPVKKLEVTLAYRLNDVKMTIHNELTTKPLLSREKAFLNLAYTIGSNDWKFDFTADYNGKGRIPNPKKPSVIKEFSDFVLYHAQITKQLGKMELYLGGENLGNFVQPHPIMGHKTPYGSSFDASMIWGPIVGRTIYFGLRYTVY